MRYQDHRDITKDGKVEVGWVRAGRTYRGDAILVRSTDLHGYELPGGIRAIGRCGAGVNNIPIEGYAARRGVVVFNSPGANANAVKEIVITAMMHVEPRNRQAMKWVRDNADDPTSSVDAEKAKKAFVGGARSVANVGVGVGLGNVGPASPNACVELGMDVFGYDPFISVENAWALNREVQRGHARGPLPRLRLPHLARACKGRYRRHDLTEQIDLLAPGAVLINYARETIIDEDAVDAALRGQAQLV